MRDPAGVEEQGASGWGFIQEPGRPKLFHSKDRLGRTGEESPGP
jgi:hypothetical protein